MIAAIAILALALALFFLRGERVSLVTTGSAVLFQSWTTLSNRWSLVDSYDGEGMAIYTPPAALEAISKGAAAGSPSACFGIVDEAAHEVFGTVFVPDEAAMWALAYEAWPDAVVIYDESSDWEVALAGSSHSRSLSYSQALNSVTEDGLLSQLDEMGAEEIIVYSPGKVAGLLRRWDGLVIVDRIYASAFESGQDVATVGEDLDAMVSALSSGATGRTATPYRIDR